MRQEPSPARLIDHESMITPAPASTVARVAPVDGDGPISVCSAGLADVIVDGDDGYELVLTPVLLPVSLDGVTAPVVGADAVFAQPGGVVLVDVLGNDFDADGNLDGPSLAITRKPGLGDALVFVSVVAGLVVRYVAGDVVGADGFANEICDTLGACATGEVTVTVGTTGCTIVGTDGDDVLRGTRGADVICGLGGDDTIVGLGGDDVIWGGAGDDVIEGRGGDDVILGGDGDDRLFGEAGADTLTGGAGGGELWGGPGVDNLHGNTQDDILHGGGGDDTLVGGGGTDTLWGNAGADRLDGGAGMDTIDGGDGFDTILSADLTDMIVDDADGYELILTRAPAVPIAPFAGHDAAHVTRGETLDVSILGNDYDPDENLVAASVLITATPTLGTAQVVASAESGVVIRYVAGNSDGADTFTYQVCDTLNACATARVTITVGTSHCTIVDTDADDVLRGTPGPDIICGLGGGDTINGIGADDIIIGGPGNDTLTGGNGDDTLHGGMLGQRAGADGEGGDGGRGPSRWRVHRGECGVCACVWSATGPHGGVLGQELVRPGRRAGGRAFPRR